MNKLILLPLVITLTAFALHSDFLTEQRKYERVLNSIEEKELLITETLKAKGLRLTDLNILLVAYKAEDELELYAKKSNESVYKKLADFTICANSGQLGPKRKKGDYQVPEGFYHIDRFNPMSRFYLSLGVNYPNQADKIKSKAANLGGDIFIHGSCVTIGCLPMTDDKMKEIYLYAVHARNSGQQEIPVYLFPFRMTEHNFNRYKTTLTANPEIIDLWTNLKTGYDKFQRDKKELNVTVDSKGDYVFSSR